jgi:hypothetical protein
MPTIIGHHNLTKGAKHWLTSPKRKELFGPLGVTNIRTFVDPQNPTRVDVALVLLVLRSQPLQAWGLFLCGGVCAMMQSFPHN